VSNYGAPIRSVEVFIVDTHGAAARALGAHRPTAESTHVLCRHADECASDFQTRVIGRMERIGRCRRIRSLWYVVGAEGTERPCALPLLSTLMSMLDSGASLTVVGPGTHQGAVFEWLDSLIPAHRSRVTVRAQLYAHSQGAGVVHTTGPLHGHGPMRRAAPRSTVSLAVPSFDADRALVDSARAVVQEASGA
jgi:hypothetical protein